MRNTRQMNINMTCSLVPVQLWLLRCEIVLSVPLIHIIFIFTFCCCIGLVSADSTGNEQSLFLGLVLIGFQFLHHTRNK